MKLFLYFTLVIISPLMGFGQITIMEPITNSPVATAVAYDSLTNMCPQKYGDEYTFHHLIGQTLMYCGDPYSSVSRTKGLNIGDYFEVTGVLPNLPAKGWYKRFSFRNTETGEEGEECDISYEDYNFKWLVVGHFEKIKSLYVGKEFILLDASKDVLYKENCLINAETDAVAEGIEAKSIWRCTDVQAKLRREDDHMRIDDRSPVVLFFENEKYGKFYCYFERSQSVLNNGLVCNRFLPKSEYDDKKISLIKKYGESNAELILDKKVKIGMTAGMCFEAWGEPSAINTITGGSGQMEQWVYDYNCCLYFKNGVLTDIQN